MRSILFALLIPMYGDGEIPFVVLDVCIPSQAGQVFSESANYGHYRTALFNGEYRRFSYIQFADRRRDRNLCYCRFHTASFLARMIDVEYGICLFLSEFLRYFLIVLLIALRFLMLYLFALKRVIHYLCSVVVIFVVQR